MNSNVKNSPAAIGGPGWSPRITSMKQDIGSIWSACGLNSEISKIKRVLLHRPGGEIEHLNDPDSVQMLSHLDPSRAVVQHNQLARIYRKLGIHVDYLDPEVSVPPNLMFIADLIWMTPEGAVIGRPASTVRAGEEVLVARQVAELGIPILLTIGGCATFECADALWLNGETVLIANGFRTNRSGIEQVRALLNRMGVKLEEIELSKGNMHLMGQLRFIDHHRTILWKKRSDSGIIEVLQKYGYQILDIPDELECSRKSALNFVTVAPREVVIPAGNPRMSEFLRSQGVVCHDVEVDELSKAAGAIACLTGILERE